MTASVLRKRIPSSSSFFPPFPQPLHDGRSCTVPKIKMPFMVEDSPEMTPCRRLEDDVGKQIVPRSAQPVIKIEATEESDVEIVEVREKQARPRPLIKKEANEESNLTRVEVQEKQPPPSPPSPPSPAPPEVPRKQQRARAGHVTSPREYWAREYQREQQQQQQQRAEELQDGTGTGTSRKRPRRRHDFGNDEERPLFLPSGYNVRAERGDDLRHFAAQTSSVKDDQVQKLRAEIAQIESSQARAKAMRDLHLLYNTTLSFGFGKCRARDGQWTIANFDSPLYHHQVIGIGAMVKAEVHPTGARGGILADEMGLGKTVQALGLISSNPWTAKDGDRGWAAATLIVVPAAVLGQWEREIFKHCAKRTDSYTGLVESRMTTIAYRKGQRPAIKAETLRMHRIV